jgi:hypothetical protein
MTGINLVQKEILYESRKTGTHYRMSMGEVLQQLEKSITGI